MSRMIDDEEALKDYGLIENWDNENTDYKRCKEINCYKKQLKRLQAENEKLKKDIHNIYENCKYCDEFYMNKCNYIKKKINTRKRHYE